MPKEFRKRGKRKPKQSEEDNFGSYGNQSVENQDPEENDPAVLQRPSWIRSAPEEASQQNKDAPYGYVSAEVKAYFRTVDVQIRTWQDDGYEDGDDEGPNDLNANEGEHWHYRLLDTTASSPGAHRETALLYVCPLRDVGKRASACH